MFSNFHHWVLVLVPLFMSPLHAWAKPGETQPPASDFEDPISPLIPRRPRTEVEEDRVSASALFAHGRILMQRREFDAALRRFQRSWRYDSQSVSFLDEMVVGLAVSMKRYDEAARYAALSSAGRFKDVKLLRPLADYLTRQREFDQALRLYEMLLVRQKNIDIRLVVTRMEMGRLYFLTGDHKKSSESFAIVREALDNPKKYSLVDSQVKLILGKAELTYVLLGESFLLAGRHDDAEAMYRKSNEAKKNEPLLAFRLARIQARRGKTDEALKNLDAYFKAKAHKAGDEPYKLLQELIAKKEKDKKLAEEQLLQRLTKLYEADEKNVALGYFLAQRLIETDRLDEAEKLFVALLKAEPTLEAHRGLIDVYRRQDKIEPLLNSLGKAVVDAESLEPLGKAAADITSNAPLVKKLLDLAGRQQKENALAQGVPLATALLALDAKQFETAGHFYELALKAEKPEKSAVMVTWGLQMFMAQQYDRAALTFRRAIDEKVLPKNDRAFYFYLAGALELGGNTDRALEAAKKAADLDPKSARFRSRASWIAYHARRYDQAEEGYKKLLAQFDSNHQSADNREVMRDARLVLSNINVHKENMPQAEEWLEQVLDEYPRHIGAMNDLGYLWTDQGKHLHRALVMIQAAVVEEPDNIAYRDSLGWAYYRLGNFPQAVKELEKAAAGEEPDGVILDHLGDAYLKAKQVKKALATWQRAVKNFDKEKDEKFLRATKAKIEKHSPK